MEKIKSLLSFALGICLTSTTFKVLSNSLSVEVDSKSHLSVAANTVSSNSLIGGEKPSISAAIAVKVTETADVKSPVSVDSIPSDIWKKIADIESEENHYQNAIEALMHAINLQPKNAPLSKNAPLYVSLSEIYAVTNQYKEALTAIDEALQIESRNIDYLNRRVMLAKWAGEYDQVEDSYKRILDIESKNKMAIVGLKNIETEKAKAKLNINASPVLMSEVSAITTDAVAPFTVPDAAIVAEEEKNWDKAIAIYKEEIAKNSNRPDLWKKIADIENEQKHYQNAIESLKQAINLQSNNAGLYISLSETYAVTNQAKEALAAINQALEIAPMNIDYLNRRVILANWAGEYDQVEDSYKRILSIEPNNQLAHVGLKNIQSEKEKANAKVKVETDLTANEKPPVPVAEEVKENETVSVDKEEIANDANLKDLNLVDKKAPGETYAKQAKKYADANKNEEALVHINLAIKKEPNNIAYHKLQAERAMQEKNYALASKSYFQILQIEPHNRDGLLGVSNLEVARNNLDAAVDAYENYLCLYPDSKEVWLDYAKVQSWRGNYVAAFRLIKEYRDRYGESYEYLSVKARLFEMSGYPEHALSLIKELLVNDPNDYELLFTEAAALQMHNEPTEAMEALCDIERKFPNKVDNKWLNYAILTPSRTSLSLDGYFCHDSDNIKIVSSGIHGAYFLTPETSMIFGLKHENLSADIGTGLETIDGHGTIWDSAHWVGLTHQIYPEIAVSGLVGAGEIKKRSSFFRYDLNLITNPSDYIQIAFKKGQDIYAFSPRSVSLKTLQKYNRMTVNLQPYPQKYLDIGLEYDKFSDKNTLKVLSLYPHATVLASQYLDIDIGPYATWQNFSLQDPVNGYYDPRSYQMYQALSHFTIKQNENINYVLTFGAGAQKDETMLKPGFAGDIALRAIYGIYADWYLNISASATARNSSSLLYGSGTKYRIYAIEALLTKRF